MTKPAEERNRIQALLDCFPTDTIDDLIFWGFRYFMGRGSIHAYTFTQDLQKAAAHLDERTVRMMAREIREELERWSRSDADKDWSVHAVAWQDTLHVLKRRIAELDNAAELNRIKQRN